MKIKSLGSILKCRGFLNKWSERKQMEATKLKQRGAIQINRKVYWSVWISDDPLSGPSVGTCLEFWTFVKTVPISGTDLAGVKMAQITIFTYDNQGKAVWPTEEFVRSENILTIWVLNWNLTKDLMLLSLQISQFYTPSGSIKLSDF